MTMLLRSLLPLMRIIDDACIDASNVAGTDSLRLGKNSTLSNLLSKRGPFSAVNASFTGMAAVSNFGDNVNWTGSILGTELNGLASLLPKPVRRLNNLTVLRSAFTQDHMIGQV
jgi:alpha-glucuronidase